MRLVLRCTTDRKGRICFGNEHLTVYVEDDPALPRPEPGDVWELEAWRVPGKRYLKGRLVARFREVCENGVRKYIDPGSTTQGGGER